jgi:LacI family transcriptional regulator
MRVPSEARKPTVMDVAREAGVSHMTVSRVFSGQSVVATRTRERVIEAAQQLGYRPNQVARSLAQARTRTLGLLMLSNLWFKDTLIGAEEIAQRSGYGFVHTSARFEAADEQERIEMLRQRQVDGLLLLSSSDTHHHEHLRALHQGGVPLVTINRYCEEMGFWRLFFDFRGATRAAARRLLAAGHRRILFLGGSPDHPQGSVRERIAGYREALREAGLWTPEAEVFGGERPRDGEELMARALQTCPEATAMLTITDFTAAGALRALRRAGRRVPEEMAVISLHDTDVGLCTDPPLTAIKHPTYQAGCEGCRLLIAQIEQPNRPTGTLVLPASLVVRQSYRVADSDADEEIYALE